MPQIHEGRWIVSHLKLLCLHIVIVQLCLHIAMGDRNHILILDYKAIQRCAIPKKDKIALKLADQCYVHVYVHFMDAFYFQER